MNILENITNQTSYYKRGLLTYTEMLENIIKIASDEMPRLIEIRKGNNGKWKVFSDRLYNKEEVNEVLESLNYNSMGYQFRAVMAK